MANRQLTKQELDEKAWPLIEDVRSRLQRLSGGNSELLWALRRKLAKELSYDERGKPTERSKLKAFKRGEQGGRCARCQCSLPEKDTVLDRIDAMARYTRENTRLLCRPCDYRIQEERRFA